MNRVLANASSEYEAFSCVSQVSEQSTMSKLFLVCRHSGIFTRAAVVGDNHTTAPNVLVALLPVGQQLSTLWELVPSLLAEVADFYLLVGLSFLVEHFDRVLFEAVCDLVS